MKGPHNDKTTTVKDMSEAYIEQLSMYQMQIDDYWQKTVLEPQQIVFVNERIHQLFKKVSPKMNENEKKRQFNYEKILMRTQKGMFSVKKVINQITGQVIPVKNIHNYKFAKYKHYLEKREIELNSALERIGLTATSKEVKRRLH